MEDLEAATSVIVHISLLYFALTKGEREDKVVKLGLVCLA